MQTSPSTPDTDLQADNLRRAAIDKSVRGPVLFLFTNGAFWLMLSTLLGVLAAIKLVEPEFLGDCQYITYGRLQPAHINALVYGWGVQAALGFGPLGALGAFRGAALPAGDGGGGGGGGAGELSLPLDGVWSLGPQELAEQWTLLDHAAFARVPLHELLDCAWDKPRYEHGADAVRRYVDRFNAVALWVSAEVLAQPGDEERAALIVRAVQLAAQMRRLNNFCGVSAVCMALRRESVARLFFAWELVPRAAAARLAELSQMIQDKEQYRRYKEALRGATTGAAAGGTPAVPHLGAHTMEMTAAEMNLPETAELPGAAAAAGAAAPRVVNFKRYRTLLGMAAPLAALQGRCYLQSGVIAAPSARVQGALRAALRPFFFPGDEEREAAVARLEARSLRVEPPEAHDAAAAQPQPPAPPQQQYQQLQFQQLQYQQQQQQQR